MTKRLKKSEQARSVIATASAFLDKRHPVRDKIASVIRIRPDDLTTSAGIASAYKSLATEINNAARSSSFPDSTAQHILVFHAIELALKAYLIHSGGFDQQQLAGRKFSHNLINLYNEATKNGLNINDINDREELIKWSNEYHDKGLIRYDIENLRNLPKCEILFPLVDAILKPHQRLQ
jgi:hypothetical protein